MRERLATAGGALLALLVVYVLFFDKGAQAPISRPVSTETGRNGYVAIAEWLEQGGVRVVSYRQRFDALLGNEGQVLADAARSAPALAPAGNVLITTMPHLIPLRAAEHQSLNAWVRRGNTLLMLAALNDTPEWTPQSATADFLADVRALAGVELEPLGSGEHQSGSRAPGGPRPAVAANTTIELDPVAAHPLMRGVGIMRGYSDLDSAVWMALPVDARFDEPMLRLAVDRGSGADAAWQRISGDGSVILVASGSLLANHLAARSDAAFFLANVVRHHVRDGGAVLFDDMHQGLTALYDPGAFYRDRRVHYTAAFLVAAWLIYLLGSSNRLAPPAAVREAPRQRDFLNAAGGFLARRLDRRDAGLMLLEEWFAEIRRARGLPPAAEPPWEAIRETPALGASFHDKLRDYRERLESGRPVSLIRLHNLLRQAREAIG